MAVGDDDTNSTLSLENLTVKLLKEKCKAQGLCISGTKAELISRLSSSPRGTPSGSRNASPRRGNAVSNDDKRKGDTGEKTSVKVVKMITLTMKDSEDEHTTAVEVEPEPAEARQDVTIATAADTKVSSEDVSLELPKPAEDVPMETAEKVPEAIDAPDAPRDAECGEDVAMERTTQVAVLAETEAAKAIAAPGARRDAESGEDVAMERATDVAVLAETEAVEAIAAPDAESGEDVAMERTSQVAVLAETEAAKAIAAPDAESGEDVAMERATEVAVLAETEKADKKDGGQILVDLEPSDEEAEAVASGPVEYRDFAPDDRPRISTSCTLHGADTSLDTFLGPVRNSMTSLCCEGFQYLFCRARTNFGLVGGLYCFELRWLEKSRSSGTVRFGFSPVDYNGLLNDAESVGFNSDGAVYGAGLDGVDGAKFEKGDTLSVIVDFQKPSVACLSFFINGTRVCPKIYLPERLKKCLEANEAIFPTFCCKNAAFMINFGKKPWADLPFKVRMLNDAAEADMRPNPTTFLDHPEVLFPIILPGQEASYQAPKGYIMCSEQALLEWIAKSDNVPGAKGFAVKSLDDRTLLLSMLRQIAASRGQNVCVINENLLETNRRELLSLFSSFRKRAVVHIDQSLDIDAESNHPSFPKYTLPSKEEGFDEITFTESESKEAELLAAYVDERKLLERLNPNPSSDFTHACGNSMKDIKIWMNLQKSTDTSQLVEADDDDIMTANAFNGGPGGRPLFIFFTDEDWFILQLRFEFALLLQSFCKDCDRQGFHIKHFRHYLSRYFSRNFKPKDVNLETFEEVIKTYVHELHIDGRGMVMLREDAQVDALHILRLVEVLRRDRVFRIEAGDEEANISFPTLKDQKAKKAEKPEEKRRDRSRSRRNDRDRHRSRSRSRRRRDDRRNTSRRR